MFSRFENMTPMNENWQAEIVAVLRCLSLHELVV